VEIRELKEIISNNSINLNPTMVWLLEDYSSWFIAKQYINEISKNKNLLIRYVSSLEEIPEDSLLPDNHLYIYKIEELKTYESKNNLIIVCEKSNYKESIKIPHLEGWQFIDYIKTLVPGVSPNDLEWLLTQYEYTYDRVTTIRYFRFLNDIKKISIFPEDQQEKIFNELYLSGEYDDVSNLTIFDLSNSIMKRDPKVALEVLKVFPYIDSKPDVWLLSILLNNFKKVIDIQFNPGFNADDLGLSDKQYYAVKKNNVGVYSNDRLISIYEMLTNCEFLYKFGGLSTNQLVDYMVCKIFGE